MSLYHTKAFWNIVLGKDWGEEIFSKVIEKDPKIARSIKLINSLYDNKIEIYPKDRFNIFRAFRECPKDKFKVLFLGQDPYCSIKATGLAFANDADTQEKDYSPSLRIIQDALERSYPGSGSNLDPSLLFWARQGVLLLNSSLTVCPNNKYDFLPLWRAFISGVIKVATYQTEKVVVLMGNVAKSFEKDIDMFNCVIETVHPSHCARNNTALDLDFKEIDHYLQFHYGEKIMWIKDQ